MVAALLKIVSTGMQDEQLQPPKDQPQLSAFRTILIKAGRFGTQWVRVDFDTRPELGTAAVARLPVQGEIISRVFLVTDMPDIYSAQRRAFNYFPGINPVNSNYEVQYLFGDGEYKTTSTYVYEPSSSPGQGIWDFDGIQLEGLVPGTQYTIQFNIPYEQNYNVQDLLNPQARFSCWLSDKAYSTSDFNLLKTDTFYLQGKLPPSPLDPIDAFEYSFDGYTWQSSTIPTISAPAVVSVVNTGTQFVAGGIFIAPNTQAALTYSSNLTSWAEPFIPTGYTSGFTRRFGKNSSVVVACIDEGASVSGGAYSTDGVNYTKIPTAGAVYQTIRHAAFVTTPTKGDQWFGVGDINGNLAITTDDLTSGWQSPIATSYTILAPFSQVVRILQSDTNPDFIRVFVGGNFQDPGNPSLNYPILIYEQSGISPATESYAEFPSQAALFLLSSATCSGLAFKFDSSSTPIPANNFAVCVGVFQCAAGQFSISASIPTNPNSWDINTFGKVWNTPVNPGNGTAIFGDARNFIGGPPPITWRSTVYFKIKNNLSYTASFSYAVYNNTNSGLASQSYAYPDLIQLDPGQTTNILVAPIFYSLGGNPPWPENITIYWTGPQAAQIEVKVDDLTDILSITDTFTGTPAEIPQVLLELGKDGVLGIGNDVAYNGSMWVAVGQWGTGGISTSTDGITWSIPFDPVGSTVSPTIGNGISWNSAESKWVAAGSWGTNLTIATSSDGITWFVVNQGLVNYAGAGGSASEFFNGKTLVGGLYSKVGSGNFSSSSDGVTWSLPQYPSNINFSGTATLSSLVYNGSLYLATGSWEVDGNPAQFARSTTGTSWTAFQPAGIVANPGSATKVVAWNGSYWLMGGTGYTGGGLFSKSTNGIAWSSLTGISGVNGGYVESLAWNGSYWIAGGEFLFGGLYVGSIAKSSDGVSWTIVYSQTNANTNGHVYSVDWNGSYWLAGGTISLTTGRYALLWKSIDGTSWTDITSPENTQMINVFASASYINDLEWNGYQWLASGAFYGITSTRKGISADGMTWSPVGGIQPGAVGTRVASRRVNPYIPPPFFNTATQYAGIVSGTEVALVTPNLNIPGGFQRTFNQNLAYGAATQWLLNLYNTDNFVYTPSFQFTATNQRMFLNYGAYRYRGLPIRITLSFTGDRPAYLISPFIGPKFGWTNSLGHALVQEASFGLGGTLMDTIPGELMEVLDEFQTPVEKVPEVSREICRKENGFNQRSFGYTPTPTQTITPLPFWFGRGDPGCYLPIDALYVDEARVTIRFRPATSLYYTESRITDASGQVVESNVEGAALWPILGSKFYYSDPSGSLVAGLEPVQYPTTKVREIPGITMPTTLNLTGAHLLVQYIYLDKPEANRFRIADLQIPVVQHYSFDPVDNERNNFVRIPLFIPNPTRDIFFYCQRYTASGYNAHFLASRDLSNGLVPYAPWWPDASGLGEEFYGILRPGFVTRDSEPLRWLALTYEETLVRYSTENVALFRSLLPSIEQRKAPWVNRYYYNLPFGTQNGFTPFSQPIGQANLDKIQRTQLVLGFHGKTGCLTADYVDRYNTRIFAETYNVLRIYGGRGAMMFAY